MRVAIGNAEWDEARGHVTVLCAKLIFLLGVVGVEDKNAQR